MEELKLSDILLKYLEFLADPSQKMESEISAMLSKIVVRQYLPLEDKIKLMGIIINQAKIIDESALVMSMNIEIGKLVEGLIAGYCVNITNDLDLASLQLSIFDLLYTTGFEDYILEQGAEKDYKRFCCMIDNALNFSNLMNLLDAFTNIDPKNIDAFNKTVDQFKNSLTTENIELLKTLVSGGNPEVQQLHGALSEVALDEVMNKKRPDEYVKSLQELNEAIENNIKKEQEESKEE